KLAGCCHPIYGDDVIGFVSVSGGIRIHRIDCINIKNLQDKYPYRIVRAKWSGKSGSQYSITLRVIGQDDIGIVSNISSIINKENDTLLRSINIDSNAGLFNGHLTVLVSDLSTLTSLIKKIKTVKGVKQVDRVN
ncbi:MAG: bifunctional (p)ppGpp synthetase/guanosine-3',5'-bis(diphosphate) 3'-pyrophosphohydrolase, partial [Bacteroidales bacterium]|nr:bifunctional (p)ppGpp synthetase/guanosine-3',5'-bis(diphosphate) 3'-pyrophosphohydrolase [Bacteroidales bacterium]